MNRYLRYAYFIYCVCGGFLLGTAATETVHHGVSAAIWSWVAALVFASALVSDIYLGRK